MNPHPQSEQVSRVGQAIAEFLVVADAGESFDIDVWLQRYADVADVLREFISDHLRVGQYVAGASTRANRGGAEAALNARDSTSSAGSSLKSADMVGPYDVLHELGRGGMGVVYAARHRQLNRLVALKILKLGVYASEDDCRRFEREVEAVARLDHPAIIPVYEVGQHRGVPYFAMKLVEGGTLRHWLEEHAMPADHRSMCDAIRCLLQIASGVQHAHERGVLHRDLKPANILLDKDRRPVVADFGLAKDFDSNETTVGGILGTPGYIAPEQVAGVSTIASDIWAFGAVMYSLLTSQPPFAGSSFSEYVRNLEADRPRSPKNRNPQVPNDIQTICMKCLRREPGSRYASMAEVRGDLQAYLDNRPISARPVSHFEATAKFLQRNLAAAVAYSLLITVFLAAGSWIVIDGQRSRQEVLRNRLRAEVDGLVTAISIADLEQLEPLLEWRTELDEGVSLALRREWQLVSQADTDRTSVSPSGKRLKMLNIALALADEPHMLPWLWTQLEFGTPREVAVLANRLSLYDPQFQVKCEVVLTDHHAPIGKKLRLAATTSHVNRSYQISSDLALPLVEQLLQMPPLEFAEWARLLQTQLHNFTSEFLSILQDDDAVEQRRLYAAELLAQSVDDSERELFEPLLESRPQEFSIIWQQCTGKQQSSLAKRAEDYFSRLSGAPLSEPKELRRLARAGVIVALAGEFELLLRPLSNREDPRLGTLLIHNLPEYGLDVTKLWQVIKEVRMAATRFALLSCLAGYSKTDWPKSQFEEAQRVLSEWYAQESDSGIRAVAELILRRWGIEPSRTIQLEELETAKRRWFVNRQLQTYIIIDAEGFPMGSAIDESERDVDEVQHWRNISRRFAIAATEVTRRDFLRYRPDFPFRGRGIADSQSRPVGGVDWYSAAAYCNWLSDQEGIPREQWCYEPNDDGEYAAGMRIVPDSLQRTGYRLPTEAEWEFACRSGSRTSRYYGDDVALLDRYAWYSLNANDRSHAVGMLLPNGFGLFDTLGNVYEWCHDVSSSYPVAEGEQLATGADPIESEVATHDAQRRNLRGGSYDYSARHSRAAYRTNDNLDFVVGNDGFRPARTLPRNSSLNGR